MGDVISVHKGVKGVVGVGVGNIVDLGVDRGFGDVDGTPGGIIFWIDDKSGIGYYFGLFYD